MSEVWTRDTLGFVTNGKEFFHQKDMKALSKDGEDSLIVHFFVRGLKITWSDPRDRDKFFDIFKSFIMETEEKGIKHSEYHHNYMEAQLATQKSIIGANIEVVK